MFVYTKTSSKRKSKTKVEKKQYQDWLNSINSIPLPSNGKKKKFCSEGIESKSYTRETVRYESRGDGVGAATKPIKGMTYTGDKMLGIGTLHKSNAVPIFSDSDAKDQANMRR